VLDLINDYYPDVWPEYDWIYNQGGADTFWASLKKEIAAYCEQEKFDYEISFEADHKERMEAAAVAE
jgi:hypothetical protein